MKKTISIIAMATLCLFLKVDAQVIKAAPTLHPLRIGEQLPELTLTHVYHYNADKIDLGKLGVKLIIIDFWATWCTSCLANFPKIEELQRQFKGQVQFLSVTYQEEALVNPFLKKFYQGKTSVVPVLTDDVKLHQLFPHKGIPHYVWLDGNGKLLAATSGKQVNAANIQKMLSDSKTSLKPKIDLDDSKPIFIDTTLLKYNVISHYSLLFKNVYDGLSSGVVVHKDAAGKRTGLTIRNSSLSTIYQVLMYELFRQKGDDYANAKRMLLVSDSSKVFFRPGTVDSLLYTYTFHAPGLQENLFPQYMLEDLNRYSGYEGSIEKLKVKCLVLRSVGDKNLLKSGDQINKQTSNGTNPGWQYKKIQHLMMGIVSLPFIKIPVEDETGCLDSINITISGGTNLSMLRKELQKYGLELVNAERKLNMFVLRDHPLPSEVSAVNQVKSSPVNTRHHEEF